MKLSQPIIDAICRLTAKATHESRLAQEALRADPTVEGLSQNPYAMKRLNTLLPTFRGQQLTRAVNALSLARYLSHRTTRA